MGRLCLLSAYVLRHKTASSCPCDACADRTACSIYLLVTTHPPECSNTEARRNIPPNDVKASALDTGTCMTWLLVVSLVKAEGGRIREINQAARNEASLRDAVGTRSFQAAAFLPFWPSFEMILRDFAFYIFPTWPCCRCRK